MANAERDSMDAKPRTRTNLQNPIQVYGRVSGMHGQPTLIDRIKDSMNIVTALEIFAGSDFSRVRLDRRKVSIRCPFHHDKSPSLSVFLEDDRFRCWAGCNNGLQGDVIDVVALSCGLTTTEAVKRLSVDLGLTGGGPVDHCEAVRLNEKRRAADTRRINAAEIAWTTSALQWLVDVIDKRMRTIQTEDELEWFADWIRRHSTMEHYLDALLGFEDATESDIAEIIKYTKRLMEGAADEWKIINSNVGKSF